MNGFEPLPLLHALLELPDAVAVEVLKRLPTVTQRALHSSCKRFQDHTKYIPSQLKLSNLKPGVHSSTTLDLCTRFPSAHALSLRYPSVHGQLPPLSPGVPTQHDVLSELVQYSPTFLSALTHLELHLQKLTDVPEHVRPVFELTGGLRSLHLRSCDHFRDNSIWEFTASSPAHVIAPLTDLVNANLYRGTSLAAPACQQCLTRLHIVKPARRSSIGLPTLVWQAEDLTALCRLRALKVLLLSAVDLNPDATSYDLLSALTSLSHLTLTAVRAPTTLLPALARLPALAHLDISSPSLHGPPLLLLPPAWSALTALTHLAVLSPTSPYLPAAALHPSALTPLPHLPRLATLTLSTAHLTHPLAPPLRHASSLRRLTLTDASDANFAGDWSDMPARLPLLTTLVLDYRATLGTQAAQAIGHLTTLHHLTLKPADIHLPPGIAHGSSLTALTLLTTLSLPYVPLSLPFLASLPLLPNLLNLQVLSITEGLHLAPSEHPSAPAPTPSSPPPTGSPSPPSARTSPPPTGPPQAPPTPTVTALLLQSWHCARNADHTISSLAAALPRLRHLSIIPGTVGLSHHGVLAAHARAPGIRFSPPLNVKVDDAGLAALATHCPHLLPDLVLSGSEVSPAGLAALATAVTTAGAPPPPSLWLALGSPACDAGLSALAPAASHLTSLTIASLASTRGPGLAAITAAAGARLARLALHQCTSLEDGALHALARDCVRLTELQLHGGLALSDAGVRALAHPAVPMLKKLEVGGAAGVSERSLVGVAGKPSLESLQVVGCGVSAKGLQELKGVVVAAAASGRRLWLHVML